MSFLRSLRAPRKCSSIAIDVRASFNPEQHSNWLLLQSTLQEKANFMSQLTACILL